MGTVGRTRSPLGSRRPHPPRRPRGRRWIRGQRRSRSWLSRLVRSRRHPSGYRQPSFGKQTINRDLFPDDVPIREPLPGTPQKGRSHRPGRPPWGSAPAHLGHNSLGRRHRASLSRAGHPHAFVSLTWAGGHRTAHHRPSGIKEAVPVVAHPEPDPRSSRGASAPIGRRVDSYEVALDLTDGGGRPPSRTFRDPTAIRFTPRPGDRPSSTDRRPVPPGHAERRGDVDVAASAAPGGIPLRRSRRPTTSSSSTPTAATPTPARACTASSTRSTTRSTCTRSSKPPTPSGCSRASTSPTSRPRSTSR